MLELIGRMRNEYRNIEIKASGVNEQIQQICMMSPKSACDEEQIVKHSIYELWQEYSYLSKGVIYHLSNYIKAMERLLDYIETLEQHYEFPIITMTPDDIANPITFELDLDEKIMQLKCTLFDLNDNPIVKNIINTEIMKTEIKIMYLIFYFK